MPHESAHQELYDTGMVLRRKVMGDVYVDNQLQKGASEFMKPIQQLATEVGWGNIWARPGLELKQRSLINLALLALQAKEAELTGHIRGAVLNGASEIEIRETLLHAAVYCGIPTGMESFRVADKAVRQLKEEGLLPK